MANPQGTPDTVITANKASSGITQGFNLIYPNDLEQYPDFMTIYFYKYVRNNPLQQNTTNTLGTISLPLPNAGLQDTYQINYNKVSGALLGALVNEYGSKLNLDDPTTTRGLTDTGKLWGGNFISTSVLERINGILGTQIPNDVATGLFEQTLGKTINPNPSLTFNGIELKDHRFVWKLSARTPAESSTIEQIIYQLKYNSLPQRASTGPTSNFVLNYPSILGINFISKDRTDTKLIEMSDQGLFLKDLRFVFEPDGHSMFFKGTGQPVSVQIEAGLVERSILTADELYKPTSTSTTGT